MVQSLSQARRGRTRGTRRMCVDATAGRGCKSKQAQLESKAGGKQHILNEGMGLNRGYDEVLGCEHCCVEPSRPWRWCAAEAARSCASSQAPRPSCWLITGLPCGRYHSFKGCRARLSGLVRCSGTGDCRCASVRRIVRRGRQRGRRQRQWLPALRRWRRRRHVRLRQDG